ncbi:phosphoesterase [Cupriavidus sp. USMAA2-4]|uniref:Phosphoesterase n=1 Tax=Cupriavidus malaysiensis TaxID=367825 RepID=A0ABN4TTJ2_9BURK|nr:MULTISPECIES: metallophosphoesterase family protein [Cupriavidus]AOY94721.1 phosphoesterase [Cupriavidus sp. USMAA2-4]AOZ02414.1 phosphoesterase [Cupriavidus sp. USMAHM13]AOZ10214.1 phosphoesterase [Cupriavidus malaysiensis]
MLAILSDIHGNLPALRAVVDAARGLGCHRFLSLGDVAGYYAQPGECIDLLRELGALNVMGNHDYYLVSAVDCPRSRLVSEIIAYQRGVVSAEQRAWLEQSVPMHAEGDNRFVHGGWNDPMDEYLYRIDAQTVPAQARRLFSGHTHVQTLAVIGERTYCNPGSVGQPRDGDPRAAFAVLDGEEIRLQRVAYDIAQTAEAMARAGFPPHYASCLYQGAQIGGRIDKVAIEY